VLGEVKCSQTLYDDIAAHGGRPILWKTGHSLIKAKMKEEHALLAGEMSGHVFFADRFFGYDDAVYAALRLLEICGGERGLCTELAGRRAAHVRRPPSCASTARTREVRGWRGARALPRHQRWWTSTAPASTFGDGWGLVRASNTQAVLVMRFEAESRRASPRSAARWRTRQRSAPAG
jgi:phosphomannomutase/phosphoglucomutase